MPGCGRGIARAGGRPAPGRRLLASGSRTSSLPRSSPSPIPWRSSSGAVTIKLTRRSCPTDLERMRAVPLPQLPGSGAHPHTCAFPTCRRRLAGTRAGTSVTHWCFARRASSRSESAPSMISQRGRLAILSVLAGLAGFAILAASEPQLAMVWDEGYTLGREARPSNSGSAPLAIPQPLPGPGSLRLSTWCNRSGPCLLAVIRLTAGPSSSSIARSWPISGRSLEKSLTAIRRSTPCWGC